MEKAKIKNLILLLLVLVNIFLLFIVITNGLQSRQAEKSRDEAIRVVMQKNGISLGDMALPDFVPATITLRRDTDEEKRRLASLIGRCDVEDLGGNIYMYRSESAIARFSGTGEIAVSFDPGIVSNGNYADAAVSVLGKMGIECSESDAVMVQENDRTIVTLKCVYDGDPVFNSRIVCTFNYDRLTLIEGSRLLDDTVSKNVPESYPDAVTILMNFLEYIDDSGQICKEITAIDFGYFVETAVIGECHLLPIWRITTDVGSFHFDALTGEIRPLAA